MGDKMRAARRRLVPLAVVIAFAGALLQALPASAESVAVEAATPVLAKVQPLPTGAQAVSADARNFDPGYLISDSAFYDGDAMSAAEVQSFLNARVPNCSSGATCLRDYRQDTVSRGADAMCNAYQGSAQETAAQIIAKVGLACNISPRVLIVLLQKEQSLITSTSPSAGAYRSATGFGCPDTAACDSRYYGFFNQVYSAAWQFKRYTNPPGTTRSFTWYPVGQTVAVRYHPNSACGSTPVYIRNNATAGLYYYTPYTPNGAALANLTGTGDGCSSYGNRNFWRLYSDWFGSPIGSIYPHGSIDTLSPTIGGAYLAGWAADPDSTDPLLLHLYVDGAFYGEALADDPRADIPNVHPAYSANTGFNETLVLSPGTHTVCVWGINVGPGNHVQIAPCRTVTVRGGSPFGWVDGVRAVPGGATIAGWAIDPDSTEPISIHVYVDGVFFKDYIADESRPDVAAAVPGYGALHGFNELLPLGGGGHSICVYAINVGAGGHGNIGGCRSVTVKSGDPSGSIDGIFGVPGGGYAAGWVIDPDTSEAVTIHIYVDDVFYGEYLADQSRPDVGAVKPGFGNNHGFAYVLPMPPGTHRICVWALNIGGGGNPPIGCRTITTS